MISCSVVSVACCLMALVLAIYVFIILDFLIMLMIFLHVLVNWYFSFSGISNFSNFSEFFVLHWYSEPIHRNLCLFVKRRDLRSHPHSVRRPTPYCPACQQTSPLSFVAPPQTFHKDRVSFAVVRVGRTSAILFATSEQVAVPC